MSAVTGYSSAVNPLEDERAAMQVLVVVVLRENLRF